MADDDAAIARELHAALNGRSRRESSTDQPDAAVTTTAQVVTSKDPTAAAPTHRELSEACSARGLSGKGRKEVLLARLQMNPPSPTTKASKARAKALDASSYQENQPYTEARQQTDRRKARADTAEAGPERTQCHRNELCIRHDKHVGMCNVQRTANLQSPGQCRRNEHCVRHNRHQGMCNDPAAGQNTTKPHSTAKSANTPPLVPPGTTFQKEFDVGFFTGTVHYYDTVRAHITTRSHHIAVVFHCISHTTSFPLFCLHLLSHTALARFV